VIENNCTSYQNCSPTVATTNSNSKKQSPTVSVYPLGYAIWTVEMLFKTWHFRLRHFYSGHCAILSTLYEGYSAILSTGHWYCALLPTYKRHCAILSTEYSIDITQYCPQNTRWILLNAVHRILDGYCSILSTEYSIDIAQYCPQKIQCFWDCKIKSVAFNWHNILRTPSILKADGQ